MSRRGWIYVALAACGAPPAPPPISGVARPPTGESCTLATPRRARVRLGFERWLGRIGDRSWLVAERDKTHVLVTLGDDGALAITPLPGTSRDNLATTIDGTHLWLDRDAAGPGHNEALFDIDLATSHPVITPVEALAAKTLDGTNSFGISAQRMLAYSFVASPPGPGFQLWDRDRHAPVATLGYPVYGLEAPPIRCIRDHCFAVTRPDTKGRSFDVQRFAPDGTTTIERLTADDRISSYLLVPDGDRTHVVWNRFARSGLFARTLDATGHPIGDESVLGSTSAKELLLAPGPHPVLALRDDEGWAIAKLAPDASVLEPAQRIGFPKATFLTIAPASDGVLAIAFTTDVPIDTTVPATTAHAVFVPSVGPRAAAIDVLFGEHRIGWAPFPLVAPGFAAVLVLAQGYGEPDGELVSLRAPCVR